MSENSSDVSFEETGSTSFSSQALKTIVTGGLTVGVLDCLAATVNAGLRGVTFAQVWQYVASGLLGRDSYEYGWMSVALGLLIHFFIAFSITAIFYTASLRLPVLIRKPFLSGALYGIAVYFVMGYIVSPLSRVAKGSFTLRGLLTGLFIHIVCIGLPIALITRHFRRRGQQIS